MFHLVTARVIKDSVRIRDWVRMEHHFTGEDAHAFSFGEQRFLTGCMNRLWSMSQSPSDTARGLPMYRNDWHRTGEFIMFDFEEFIEDVKERGLTLFYESDYIKTTFGTRLALWGYETIDVTFKLILLQRWFRKSNAQRRRLALAMAFHPRLGNGSWLSNTPLELARQLVLAAT
jgi:hypothetical protein